MIQENIKASFKTNESNWLKVSIGKGLTNLYLSLAFITLISPVHALSQIAKISAVYFNSDSSIVLETEDRNKLEIISNEQNSTSTKLVIDNSKLNGDVPVLIQQGDIEMKLSRLKSDSRSWYQSNDQVEIEIKNKSGNELKAEFNTVLDGLAYQINLASELEQPKETFPKNIELVQVANDLFEISELDEDPVFAPVEPKEEEVLLEPITVSGTHKLNASLSDRGLVSFMKSKSVAEEFMETVDIDLVQDQKFVEETFDKIDSSSLTHIGSELETRGKLADAFRAYNEALEIDPKNINARLGLARTSTDRTERFQNFLAARA